MLILNSRISLLLLWIRNIFKSSLFFLNMGIISNGLKAKLDLQNPTFDEKELSLMKRHIDFYSNGMGALGTKVENAYWSYISKKKEEDIGKEFDFKHSKIISERVVWPGFVTVSFYLSSGINLGYKGKTVSR